MIEPFKNQHLSYSRLSRFETCHDERTGQLSEERAIELYREAWGAEQLTGMDVFAEGLAILRRFIAEQRRDRPPASLRRPALARAWNPRRRGDEWIEARDRCELRGVLHRLFRAAAEDELVEHNAVAAVRVPRMREVKKPRAILTDDEIAKFIACPAVDLELRMLSLVAAAKGGCGPATFTDGTGR
jgi:integrase